MALITLKKTPVGVLWGLPWVLPPPLSIVKTPACDPIQPQQQQLLPALITRTSPQGRCQVRAADGGGDAVPQAERGALQVQPAEVGGPCVGGAQTQIADTRTHARTHARTHTHTHARTHARTKGRERSRWSEDEEGASLPASFEARLPHRTSPPVHVRLNFSTAYVCCASSGGPPPPPKGWS
jgi:hypothetical protein